MCSWMSGWVIALSLARAALSAKTISASLGRSSEPSGAMTSGAEGGGDLREPGGSWLDHYAGGLIGVEDDGSERG